jgi:hypothetical protein
LGNGPIEQSTYSVDVLKYQTFDKKGAENQFLGDFLGQKSENGSQI